MTMILILLLPMSIVHADNNVDADAQQAGPEMDTRICRDRSAAGTHRGSLFSAKRQPPNPTGLLLKFCRWCTIASHRHFSPPPDGGGCAAPDAPEGSKEWDFSSPTLPLRRRLAPHLLPALVTYRGCATSPRPLVIHEAELGNAAAPSRLDGVQVPTPPLHRHPHRLIPAKEKSCYNLGSPDHHRHSHMLAACPPHITATGGQQRLRASLHRAAGGSRLSLRRSEGPVQALVTAAHPCPQAPAGELHHLHQQLQHQLHHQVDKAKKTSPV